MINRFAAVTMLGLVGFSAAGICLGESAWVPTGNLHEARTWHTATLLSGGKVLVAGGFGTAGKLNSAELYDPASGAWSTTGPLHVARSGHTATLLADGRVLVAGGEDPAQSTSELYDPLTGVWTATTKPHDWRIYHTATLLANGKVLVAGGIGVSDVLATAEVYDPVTATWQYITSGLARPRFAHTATRLGDGRVVVVGGQSTYDSTDYFPIDSAEIYDPARDAWSALAAPGVARESAAAALLLDGKVLVAGGCCTSMSNLYDPVSGWITATPMSTTRIAPTASLLRSGAVLVAGGGDLGTNGFASVEIYDPSTGGWHSTDAMHGGRFNHTATTLYDGRVLVAGGDAGSTSSNMPSTYLASAELYVADTSTGAAIGPGYTGAWYDPAQSGHGLLIEILSDNRFYATWFAFDPAGTQQAWFTGVGTYSGNTATITDVEQPTGGRWIPNFDPTQVTRKPWGSLTFTFTDCNHGRVDFNSTAGYGTGNMNLTRLTQPLGLSCP